MILKSLPLFVFSVVLSFVFTSTRAFAGADDEAYFRQFLYRKTPVGGNDPDYPQYLYWILDSDIFSPIAIGGNKQVYLMTSLQLREDHTYTMLYQDGVGDVGAPTWNPRYCMTIEGRWSVPETSLILVDAAGKSLMRGDRLFKDGHNEVTFTFLPDFLPTDMINQSSAFVLAQSETEPRMTCFFPNPPRH